MIVSQPLSRTRGRVVLLAATLAIFLPAATGTASKAPDGVCTGQHNAVVINADLHRLWLCLEAQAQREYTVAVGSGGLGKRHAGDHRTPLGSYSLGEPRPSEEFSIFIPVSYPTAEQQRAGFTGGDIGIHGPKKGWRWLGSLATWTDWTRGCIAVARQQEIAEIAAWVKRHSTSRVMILGTQKP